MKSFRSNRVEGRSTVLKRHLESGGTINYIDTNYNLRGRDGLDGIDKIDGLMAKMSPAVKPKGIRCSTKTEWSGDDPSEE